MKGLLSEIGVHSKARMFSVNSLHLILPDDFYKVEEKGMNAYKYSLNTKVAEAEVPEF